jgi:hypothetical protein
MKLRDYMMVFLAIASTLSLAAQQNLVDLDKIVPVARQRALGLDRLTKEQRAGLAQLLIETYQIGLQKNNNQGVASAKETGGAASSTVIETQIDGEFEGWSGETVVKLINGQIYLQSEYYYTYRYAFMPKVIIYQSESGLKMKVDGIDRAIGVRRIK